MGSQSTQNPGNMLAGVDPGFAIALAYACEKFSCSATFTLKSTTTFMHKT